MGRKKKQQDRYLIIGIGIYFAVAFILKYPWILGFALAISIIAFIFYMYTKKKQNRFQAHTMSYIDKMSPFQFEEYICNLYKQLGYKNAYCTQKSGDFGADVIAQNNYEKLAIQVKKYKITNSTGVKAVQEIVAAKDYYHATRAIVLTTSYFTKSAKILATKCNVELIDRDKFIKLLQRQKGPTI